MITQCPHCNTKFEISTELVESDDPRVRCGECLNVFNAKVQLVTESLYGEPAIPMVTQKAPHKQTVTARNNAEFEAAFDIEGYIGPDDLENAATVLLDEPEPVQQSKFQGAGTDPFYSPDLQLDSASSHKVGAPAVGSEFENTLTLDNRTDELYVGRAQAAQSSTAKPASIEPTIDTQAAIDSVEDSYGSSITPDSALAHDDQLVALRENKEGELADNESAQELREHIRQRGGELPVESDVGTGDSQHRSMFLPLLCVALAFAALLYFTRDRIAQLDLPESTLITFCSITGCELPVKKDLTRLELLQHRTNIHSSLEDVLVINVDMVNNAPFRQPYPVLAIRMANDSGATVAERKFEPSDYLEAESLEQTIPTGERVRIRFEILDPGPDAVTSELAFE